MIPLNILFICTGNICRSPMAEGLAKGAIRRLYPVDQEEVVLSSAGVAGLDGEPPTGGAIEAMRRRGMDIRGHLARTLDGAMLARADLALAVEEMQLRAAGRLGGTPPVLLLKLGEVARRMTGGREPFAAVGSALERARNLVGATLRIEERGDWSLPLRAYEVADPLGLSVEDYTDAADAMEQPILDILRVVFEGVPGRVL